MKKRIKKTLSVLALCTLVFAVTGCAKEKEANLYEEFIVVDVFDSLANFQGIQSGWFAVIVKDKFNMELNIIAPNVSGGGDTPVSYTHLDVYKRQPVLRRKQRPSLTG